MSTSQVQHVVKDILEVIKDVPQESISERIAKQTVDVPVPHELSRW